jgi:hypothetical protein
MQRAPLRLTALDPALVTCSNCHYEPELLEARSAQSRT